VGNPGKVIKKVSDEMLQWKSQGTLLYQQLPSQMQQYGKPCQPLHELPTERPEQQTTYKPWQKNN
jgi:phenylacetic acid degradation protein